VVWLVLFAGAVLTISFTFFFGTQNVVVQTLMTGMLSRLIFAGLVIVAINRPFAGSVKVQPEALHAVLNEFGPHEAPVEMCVSGFNR
jgi:Na+/proline symporter